VDSVNLWWIFFPSAFPENPLFAAVDVKRYALPADTVPGIDDSVWLTLAFPIARQHLG
jgi:hypothetical protein